VGKEGGVMLESEIQDAVRLELGDPTRYPLVLWRNNVGQMIDKDNRRVVFGVGGKGAADLVGIWTHADGRGQFVAIELKRAKTKQTPEQRDYEQLVTKRGGVYAVIRSVDEARQWAEQMRSKR
jgi:hypothetical protein